jgi:hypothetical protein
MKSGNQLKEANAKSLQLDHTAASLQEELRSASDQVTALRTQLQQEECKYERSLVQFNLQLVAKDDEVQRIREQLDEALAAINNSRASSANYNSGAVSKRALRGQRSIDALAGGSSSSDEEDVAENKARLVIKTVLRHVAEVRESLKVRHFPLQPHTCKVLFVILFV